MGRTCPLCGKVTKATNAQGLCSRCRDRRTCRICMRTFEADRGGWCPACRATVSPSLAAHRVLCPPGGPPHELQEARLARYEERARREEPLFEECG